MNINHKQEIEKLHTYITKTEDLLKKVADSTDLERLKKYIIRPGWTTPAEMRMTLVLLETLQNQVEKIISLKSEIVKAADLVGAEVHA